MITSILSPSCHLGYKLLEGLFFYQIFHYVNTILTVLAPTRSNSKTHIEVSFHADEKATELKIEIDSKMETQITDLDGIRENTTLDTKKTT